MRRLSVKNTYAMSSRFGLLALLASLPFAGIQAGAQTQAPLVEHGSYHVHLLLHTIGTEEYTVTEPAPNRLHMTAQVKTADRGSEHRATLTLEMDAGYTPNRLELLNSPQTPAGDTLTQVSDHAAHVQEGTSTRTFTPSRTAFVGVNGMPASLQMMMMRYWKAHGQPRHLPLLRASPEALPVEVKLVGHDAFQSKGRMVRLTRYTVANLVFGREVLWMNESNRLAAVMTFAGGLPQEFVLDEYDAALGQLVHSGVQQEMLDLADLERQIRPEMQGSYAIVGARLIDATGAAPVEDATVVIREGRIAAAGHVSVPTGMRVVHAEGESLLPGLWEMHSHYSGVEFGPALLSAGITTARDCGGELEFLTAVRTKLNTDHGLGPHLLLAGLIDSGGPLAFGNADAETPAEGIAAVDLYADLRFEQIKVYTQLQPEVLKAITAEAHRRGMTVTGHVPAAVNAFEGVADGMDQINHLQFVTRSMLPPDGTGHVDLQSQRAQDLITLLKQRDIVIDPTLGWGEMAGHPKDLDVAAFEPGIRAAPYTLAAKFRSLGVPAADSTKFREHMETNKAVVGALYRAGVPIVAGSDTNLLGYGLDRELELYVEAGMSPMAALQTATLGAAKAMRLERESGTVEAGKRADLVLVNGNPLTNISDLRNVVSVVHEGRMYDSKRLGALVGFHR